MDIYQKQKQFEKRISSILRDNQNDREIRRRRSGKIDTKGLWRISNSQKVFKKKQERGGKRYNISLMVDCSGSMSNSRDFPAIKAAILLARAFSKFKFVSLEIFGFNYLYKNIKGFDEKNISDDEIAFQFSLFFRDSVLDEETGKVFNYNKLLIDDNNVLFSPKTLEEFNKHERHIGESPIGGNIDSEHLSAATRRIKNRDGEKIIIVLSDGEPAFASSANVKCYREGKPLSEISSREDLKLSVDRCIKSGVKLASIGIHTESVYDYYPKRNTRVINDDDIYTPVAEILSDLIKRE